VPGKQGGGSGGRQSASGSAAELGRLLAEWQSAPLLS